MHLTASGTSKHTCWTSPDSLLSHSVFLEFNATKYHSVKSFPQSLEGHCVKSLRWMRTERWRTKQTKCDISCISCIWSISYLYLTTSLSLTQDHYLSGIQTYRWWELSHKGELLLQCFTLHSQTTKPTVKLITDCFLLETVAHSSSPSLLLIPLQLWLTELSHKMERLFFFLSHQKAVVAP